MSIRQLSRKISFRLAAGFCLLFFVSSVSVFIFAYNLFSYSLKKKDREIIQTQARELAAHYKADDVLALKKYVEASKGPSAHGLFFVRLAHKNQIGQFIYVPEDLKRFHPETHEVQPLPATARDGEWSEIDLSDDEDKLDVWTTSLDDGTYLQVGKSDEDRNYFLELLQGIFGIGAVSAAGIGILGSIWYSKKVLSPLRKLNLAIRTIRAGDFEARVPVTKTGDEIDLLVSLFNEMIDRIQVLIKSMRDGMDIVAHDFRTPLTRLRAKAEVALQEETEGPAHEALLECLESSSELLTMVTSILDISEAEAGAMKLNLRPLRMKDIFAEVQDLYDPVAEERNIRISFQASASAIGNGDSVRLKRVIANLVDNALKYSNPGGHVQLTAECEAENVRITISDSGIGIDQDDLPRIWERFFRSETGRSRPGLGLGLSVVKSIVDAHGGSIDVESQVGKGSRFAVYIPAPDVRNTIQ